jgi:RNase P subunit RPR2
MKKIYKAIKHKKGTMKFYQYLIFPLAALSITCSDNNTKKTLEARVDSTLVILKTNEYYEKARNNFVEGNIKIAEDFIDSARVLAKKNNLKIENFNDKETIRNTIEQLYYSAEYNFSLGFIKKGENQIKEAKRLSKKYDVAFQFEGFDEMITIGIKKLYEAAKNNPEDSAKFIREAERLENNYSIKF